MSKKDFANRPVKGKVVPLSRMVFVVQRALYVLFDPSPLRELTHHYGLRESLKIEGFMRPKQYHWFEQLFAQHDIANVAEVGFNAGHSAFAFANLGAKNITSFDIGEHTYVRQGEAYIKQRFPQVHLELIIGDSRQTVPAYKGNDIFDAVFIDGGHSYEAAASDIASLHKLAKPGAFIIMDDYLPRYSWSPLGPKRAYDEAVAKGTIEPIEVVSGDLRGWALGRYKKRQ
ncbi:MAG TPA: class I SAM-dependent methyltransferase [Candidatus Saccharimonadales bacterium]|nr:class I SAM-dependent methyltransferase [Candidatus Saccharimonadales bacterium]